MRPGGDRPSEGPPRPGFRPDNRPGFGPDNRPGFRPDNRPGIDRPGGGGNWVNNRPGFGNNNNFNNINVNRPNFNNINNGIINRPGWDNRYPGNGGWGTWGRPGNFPAWSYRPGWNYHQGWVHGYWAGQNNNWWNNWGGFATGLALGGLGAWGVGSSLYNWGYASYANPYYVQQPIVVQQPVVVDQPVVQQTPVYDYSQPIDTTAAPPEEATADPALTAFDQAREAFKTGDFNQALAGADTALKTLPNDAAIHEFRALCLFALGQYDKAAATLYAVLSVGPGFDWTTLISLYSSVDVYTQQIRALEAYVKDHPDSAAGHFVLAYHYLTQGHQAEALRELQAVAKLQPSDTLAAQMIRQLEAATGTSETPEAEPPSAVAEAAPAPTAEQLAGTWKASPAAGVTITLTLSADKKFSWVINQGGKDQKIEGTYVVDEGDLVMTPPTGPPLSGQVALKDASSFSFVAKGGGPNDPGLTFTR
jgi:tetratricopeptide (TPR) repeat protein